MVSGYLTLVRAAAADSLGRLGVILTTSSCCTFILVELARLLGLISNAYVGLVSYLLLPALFVLGLLLLPIAWWRRRRTSGLSSRELLRQSVGEQAAAGGLAGAPIVKTIALLTLFNVLFLGAASMQMLHFMDSPRFCGTACHQVMSPEWTTYQLSPHARVACVECHVGSGADALISSKLNGAWQMVSAAFDLYQRPIPTPVHQLRPARETCEHCHWPDKHYGSRLQTLVHYGNDKASSPSYTTLNIKIDAATSSTSGVHWHVSEVNQVRYASVDDQRQEMIWVESRQPDASLRRFVNTRLSRGDDSVSDSVRVMDCVDCHNRATHIYKVPQRAVDELIRAGRIDRELPYIRREAVAAISAGYPSQEAARQGIQAHLESFYRRHYPSRASAWLRAIDAAVMVLQQVYAENVFHQMGIDWGAYPSLIGHTQAPGCFRCHNRNLQDDDGQWIADGCTLCHSILANQESEPFAYLQPPQEKARNRAMHEYLRQEFLSSLP